MDVASVGNQFLALFFHGDKASELNSSANSFEPPIWRHESNEVAVSRSDDAKSSVSSNVRTE